MQQPINCRHCGQQFTPRPGKPGFINECPDCVEERYSVKPVTAEPEAHAVKPKARVYRPMTPEQVRRNEVAMLRSIRELSRLLGNDPYLRGLADKFESTLK